MTEAIGRNIRAARKRAGLTQAQLEAKAFLPKKILYLWENGKRTPMPEQIEAIARETGATVPGLLGLDEDARSRYEKLSGPGRYEAAYQILTQRHAVAAGSLLPDEQELVARYRAMDEETRHVLRTLLPLLPQKAPRARRKHGGEHKEG